MAQELKAFGIRGEENGRMYFAEVYTKKDVDTVLAAKDAEIARLKADYSAEVEEVCVEKTNVDTLEQALEEKNAEIEALKATERRLNRALWLARLGIAKMRISWYKLWNGSISTMNPEDGARQDFDRWKNFEQECRAMVDKFK